MEGLIYAYHSPRSSGQEAYARQRLAELAARRREKTSGKSQGSPGYIEQHGSVGPPDRTHNAETFSAGEVSNVEPSLPPSFTDSVFNALGTGSDKEQHDMIGRREQDLKGRPFELRHGRRYLRNVPYPLPCDLAAIHTQNLRTLLATTVFGRPICAPRWETDTPKRVLDFACGSGYWSATAHDYFSKRGAARVEFTGLDFAPLAPDYARQGLEWKFVQHDLRRTPLPFEDGYFDIVMLKDNSLTNPLSSSAHNVLDDIIRIVKPGGTLEIWDSDHLVRALPANQPPLPLKKSFEQSVAEETGTFAVGPGFPFDSARNKYIQKANAWIAEALSKRSYFPTPCAHYGGMLLQEEALCDVDQTRIAVPFGELKWERNSMKHKRVSHGHDSLMSIDSRRKFGCPEIPALTPDQSALRHIALMTLLQGMESMEVMLKEVSGKSTEEWNNWWTAMMTEMLDPTKPILTGECLELGAWWAKKVDEDSD